MVHVQAMTKHQGRCRRRIGQKDKHKNVEEAQEEEQPVSVAVNQP